MANSSPKRSRLSPHKSSSVCVHAKANKSLSARSHRTGTACLSSRSQSLSSTQDNVDDPIEIDDQSSAGDGNEISSDVDLKKQLGASYYFSIFFSTLLTKITQRCSNAPGAHPSTAFSSQTSQSTTKTGASIISSPVLLANASRPPVESVASRTRRTRTRLPTSKLMQSSALGPRLSPTLRKEAIPLDRTAQFLLSSLALVSSR
jgi:hypothetical protein